MRLPFITIPLQITDYPPLGGPGSLGADGRTSADANTATHNHSNRKERVDCPNLRTFWLHRQISAVSSKCVVYRYKPKYVISNRVAEDQQMIGG